MKNRNLEILFVAAIVFVGIVAAFHLRSNDDADDLVLENIEALASEEYGTDYKCAGIGCVYCPISKTKVRLIVTTYKLEK